METPRPFNPKIWAIATPTLNIDAYDLWISSAVKKFSRWKRAIEKSSAEKIIIDTVIVRFRFHF